MGWLESVRNSIQTNFRNFGQLDPDPEVVLRDNIAQMQQESLLVRQALAHAIAIHRRAERKCCADKLAEQEWHRRAQVAIQAGNEELARQALTKSKSYQETAQFLSMQLDEQQEMTSQIKQRLERIETLIREAKTTGELLMMRSNSAQASTQLEEMLYEFRSGKILRAFEQVEDKVLQLEAESEAIASLSTDELESRFLSLSDADEIELQLKAMKAQTNGPIFS
ncbi:PspA/IM30 family protein [Merismopedia glauca]|uniref:Phage shock protein A n=2 Tax=Merismopedia TaxID=53402 RepID=A0A2T1BWN7_9CYAN|nr:phage shock protein A [Merismopedia glauca CCAP 1448/3]